MHMRGHGFRVEARASDLLPYVVFDQGEAGGKTTAPDFGSRREAAAFHDAQREPAMLCAQNKIFFLAQQDGNVVHAKRVLDKRAYGREKIFDLENDRGLLCDRVDDFQLLRSPAFERVQPRILERHGSLSREQREQIDRRHESG